MEASRPFADAPHAGHLLFAYGTLMLNTGIVAVDAAMRNAGRSLGRGWIHGLLFDLGDYPGAVAPAAAGTAAGKSAGKAAGPEAKVAASGTEAEAEAKAEPKAWDEAAPRVWGQLLLLKDPEALFSVIDPYEGFNPSDPAGSEFVRAETRVFLPDRDLGSVRGIDQGIGCQVYWYNFPTAGRPAIGSVDYLAYWHAKGNPVQGRAAGDFGR